MKNFTILALALSGAIFTSCSGGTTSAAPELSTQDRTFVTFAAQSSNSEIAAANIAEKNSTTTSIQQFAQKMITDHTAANAMLGAVPSVKIDIGALPSTPLPSEAPIAAQLATLSGSAFDQAYVNDQVNSHMATIAQFQQEISSGTFSDIKAFAQQQLPILQMHLQMAQQLQTSLQASAKTTK